MEGVAAVDAAVDADAGDDDMNIDGLGSKNKGYGCWPSYLPHEVKGNNILIKISDLKGGRHRFA